VEFEWDENKRLSNLAAHGICLRLDKPFDRVTLSAALSQVRAKSIKAAG